MRGFMRITQIKFFIERRLCFEVSKETCSSSFANARVYALTLIMILHCLLDIIHLLRPTEFETLNLDKR